jgi:FLVCR family feline leukemia virus subgroup C receptor-related protein
MVQLMTSVLLATLNPIAKYLTEIYDQSSTVVNLGGLLFVLMHPIFTFPAAYVIDTYGSRVGIIIGSIFGIVGISLRLFVNSSFAWVIIGQVLAGIGRPFILNCQGKISANWFNSQQRGKITQILTLVLNVSLIIGVILPTLVFGSYKP